MKRFYENPKLAQDYLKYRPDYTNCKIAEHVIEHYRKHNPHQEKLDLILDIGCGNGQSTNIFQPYSNKIIGYDVSPEQLKLAKLQNRYDNIEYRLGQAENIEQENETVDLVVAGVSIYWFNKPKFFQEVKRVLKPSGCISIFGYNMPEIGLLGNNDISVTRHGTYLLHTLLASAAIECPASLPAQVSIQNQNDDIFEALPFAEKRRIDDVYVVTTASINDICGYIRSIHLCDGFSNRRIDELKPFNITITKEVTDLFDISIKFKTLIRKLWRLTDVSDDAPILKVKTPFFALIAKP